MNRILIAVAALVLPTTVLAGCVTNAYYGHEAHVVTIEDTFAIRVAGDADVRADFGPKCRPARLADEPLRVTLDYWRDRPLPDAVVIRSFNEDARAAAHPHLADHDPDEAGQVLHAYDAEGFALDVASPFDADVTLANVTLDADGVVHVDGNVLREGEEIRWSVDHVAKPRGVEVHVTHTIVVTNHGVGNIASTQPANLCA